MLLQESVPRQQESHVVGLGASGGEGAVRGGGQSGLGAQPAHQFLFDDGGDRGLIERIHGLIECADNDFCGERREQRRAMQMSDGSRIADGNRIRNDGAQGGGDLVRMRGPVVEGNRP